MKKFCIITNSDKEAGMKAAKYIQELLKGFGADCHVLKNEPMGQAGQPRYTNEKFVPEETECAFVLGGDGTMIQAANDLAHLDIPILGVNVGTLGFLTEVEEDGLADACRRLVADDYSVEKRIMLYGYLEGQEEKYNRHALNDFVVTKSGICRLITLKVYVGEELADEYRADGIIVCTPTGSTGYNLSAGGPVLAPSMASMSITPICPHSLNNRSLVVSAGDVIRIEIGQSKESQMDEATLMVDGNRILQMKTGDSVVIRRSLEDTSLVKLTKTCFFERMREKLNGK